MEEAKAGGGGAGRGRGGESESMQSATTIFCSSSSQADFRRLPGKLRGSSRQLRDRRDPAESTVQGADLLAGTGLLRP